MMGDDRANGYSQQERDLLMDAAAKVLLAAVSADRTGPLAYFSEMTAAGTFLYDAEKRYGHNALVSELYRRQELADEVADTGPVTREELLRDIDRIASILRGDREGMEFRQFLFELAERVVKASRSGWFSPRVSPEEQQFLADLRRRLELPPGP